MTKYNYDPNSPFYTEKALEKAIRRIEEIKIRKQIYAVDLKLRALKDCQNVLYAPHSTTQ